MFLAFLMLLSCLLLRPPTSQACFLIFVLQVHVHRRNLVWEGAFCWNVGLCLVSIAVSSGCGGESLLDTRFTRAARAVEIVKLSVVCDRQGCC